LYLVVLVPVEAVEAVEADTAPQARRLALEVREVMAEVVVALEAPQCRWRLPSPSNREPRTQSSSELAALEVQVVVVEQAELPLALLAQTVQPERLPRSQLALASLSYASDKASPL
jgi:hypothetical protein